MSTSIAICIGTRDSDTFDVVVRGGRQIMDAIVRSACFYTELTAAAKVVRSSVQVMKAMVMQRVVGWWVGCGRVISGIGVGVTVHGMVSGIGSSGITSMV